MLASCRPLPSPAGGQRTFFVPFADFEGNNIPYIVTLKMVAVNANNKRSQDGSASASVTVGSAIAPTAVTATSALSGSTATVALSWQRGDTTVTRCVRSQAVVCAVESWWEER